MTIRYSETVKKPMSEHEYTPEQILELNECSEDVRKFLKYVKIVHPDKGIITFEPYDFQEQILTNLQNNRFNVVLASRQSGKCLSYNSTISVRHKKTGEIKEIFIGDLFKENKK
jgi:hypothetical protein